MTGTFFLLETLTDQALKSYIDFVVINIETAVLNKKFPITKEQIAIFETYKEIYKNLPDGTSFEAEFWRKNNIMNYGSFNELFNSKNKFLKGSE